MKALTGTCERRGLLVLFASAGLLAQSLGAADHSTPGSGTAERVAASGSLRGVTLDSAGATLAGVNVVIHGANGPDHNLFSSNDGSFVVNELQPGSYRLVASKEGFADSTATAIVAQNQTTNAQVPLTAAKAATNGIAPQGAELVGAKPDVAPLTERERQLLERISRLEEHMSALKALEEHLIALEPKEAKVVTPDTSAIPGPADSANTAAVPKIATRPEGLGAAAGSEAKAVATALPPTSPAAPQQAPKEIASASTPADPPSAGQLATASPPALDLLTPFADYDWTWLNGNPRNKDIAFDSKFFTPEIRADVTYSYDFNRPIDNSMGGSSELFRSNEVQLEQLGVGGDFHWNNVRARFMTQFGGYSTATIRNDRPQLCKGPVGSRQRESLPGGSVRRVPHRQVARDQHRCGNLHVLHRSVQLLQLR
jgi:hypothetical protein